LRALAAQLLHPHGSRQNRRQRAGIAGALSGTGQPGDTPTDWKIMVNEQAAPSSPDRNDRSRTGTRPSPLRESTHSVSSPRSAAMTAHGPLLPLPTMPRSAPSHRSSPG
jgi:hypothetical protein